MHEALGAIPASDSPPTSTPAHCALVGMEGTLLLQLLLALLLLL